MIHAHVANEYNAGFVHGVYYNLFDMPDNLDIAMRHLSAHDAVLRRLITVCGPCTIQPHTKYYQELVRSIIAQQLSVKAAATIEKRFMGLFGDSMPTPDQILGYGVEDYRSIGLSRPKAGYILDLARHIVSGQLGLEELPDMPNDAIVAELTAVKGIGEWTAHMFLIFALGRLDVLPVGDLGFRSGVRNQYGLDHLPSPTECIGLATQNDWHPYESVATWYMWQSLENA